MQTNREDVGKRYLELLIPVPDSKERALAVSEAFRNYYTKLAESREKFAIYLDESKIHHFFVSGAEAPTSEELAQVLAEESVTEDDSDIETDEESE